MRITWKQIAPFTFPILTIAGCIGHPFCEEQDPEAEFIEVGEVEYPEPEQVIVDPPKQIIVTDAGISKPFSSTDAGLHP